MNRLLFASLLLSCFLIGGIIGQTRVFKPQVTQPRFPTHILVDDLPWEIIQADNFPHEIDLMGTTDAVQHKIYIHSGMCLQEEQDTVWREIQHALFGIGYSGEITNGHAAIAKMTPKQLHLLRDNPELYEYLGRK